MKVVDNNKTNYEINKDSILIMNFDKIMIFENDEELNDYISQFQDEIEIPEIEIEEENNGEEEE